MNQIACHRRQSIIVALSPVVLDSNVMAIDITGLPESFQKRRQGPRIILRGGSIEKSDDRHCRLLRVSHGRPSGGSANYSSNEIASSHCMPQGPKTAATMTSNKRLQQEFVIGETGFKSQFYIMDVRFGPSTACTAVKCITIRSPRRRGRRALAAPRGRGPWRPCCDQNLALDVIDHSGGRPRIDTTYLSLGAVGVCSLIATPAVFVRHNERRADARLFSPAWARTRNIMAS